MTGTIRSAAERVRFCDERWELACTRLDQKVTALEHALAPWVVEGGQASVARLIRQTLERTAGSADRRDRWKKVQAILSIWSRRSGSGASPLLTQAVNEFDALNAQAIKLLKESVAAAGEVLVCVQTIAEFRQELGESQTRRLIGIAAASPEVARELLEQQIDSIALAECASASLSTSLDVRSATARAWAETAGPTLPPSVSVLNLIEEAQESCGVIVSARARFNALLEMHQRLDPRMRVLSEQAYSAVRCTLAETCESGFAGIEAALKPGHKVLGHSYVQHNRLRKGMSLLRDGRLGTNEDPSALECWRFMGGLSRAAEDRSDASSDKEVATAQPNVEAIPGETSNSRLSLDAVLAVFMSRVAPTLFDELSQLYGRDILDARLTVVGTDGATSVDCISILDFTFNNWSVPLSRRFGDEGRRAVVQLRAAAYSLKNQRELLPIRIKEAHEAVGILVASVSHR